MPTERTMNEHKVNFRGAECSLEFLTYRNGQTAIQLWSKGEPYAMATISDKDLELEPNQVLIKDYAENTGMVDALENAGIVQRVDYCLVGPFGKKAWSCNLLIKI